MSGDVPPSPTDIDSTVSFSLTPLDESLDQREASEDRDGEGVNRGKSTESSTSHPQSPIKRVTPNQLSDGDESDDSSEEDK